MFDSGYWFGVASTGLAGTLPRPPVNATATRVNERFCSGYVTPL